MNTYGRNLAVDDADLLCVEVSALGASSALPRLSCDNWRGCDPDSSNSGNETIEDFLRALLVKTDAYRPRRDALPSMENRGFLHMRAAVVNWFASVAKSYKFANETVVTALSNFDRYVALSMEPVHDHMLLQLVAYVALLVASKMSETCPLRMKSLASLTGRMFTPMQVRRVERDMMSRLQFRLAPPSADETLICLANLLHSSSPCGLPVADIQSLGLCYLKKARARTCWFRHSPYTLAVAALATAYTSLGLGRLRRQLLRECDARARSVLGRGVDIHGVAACAEAMAIDERAAAAAAAAAATAAAAARDNIESLAPRNDKASKEGWGSPTGVAQGAQLLQEMTYSRVAGVPLVEASPSPAHPLGSCAVPKAARVTDRAQVASSGSQTSSLPSKPPQQGGQKRGLPQTSGSCFVPCGRRPCVDGVPARRFDVDTDSEGRTTEEEEEDDDGESSSCSHQA